MRVMRLMSNHIKYKQMEAQNNNSAHDLVGNEVFAGDYIAIAQTHTKGGCPSIGIAQVKEITIGKGGGVKVHYIPKNHCVITLGNYLTSRFKFIKLKDYGQQGEVQNS